MELYRFEAVTATDAISVVVVAENEEKAFRAAEIELKKYFLRLPDLKEITLYEKKKIRGSAGFVIYEKETILP
ncbi:MAG: DUF3906 family protein [Ectobacillus sp.]